MPHRPDSAARRLPGLCRSLPLAIALAAASFAAPAQVQRTFVNLGFEAPDLGSSACVAFRIGVTQVPGWNTTEGNNLASGCGAVNPPTGPVLEL